MKVTVYTFFKTSSISYEYISGNNRIILTVQQFECMARQYEMMGYIKYMDNNEWVTFRRVEENLDRFMERLSR